MRAEQELPDDFQPSLSGGLPTTQPPWISDHDWFVRQGLVPDDSNYTSFKEQNEFGSPGDDRGRMEQLFPQLRNQPQVR